MELVPQPTRFDIEDLIETGDVLGGVANFANDGGIDSVEHTGQHGRGRLQDDAEDGDGDEQANDGIGKRKTEPDTGGTQDDSEAVRPSVRA